MTIYTEKYGFVYIWFDKKRKMYYIGSHWGTEDDGYICSSNWLRTTYKRRPQDFKRRIVSRIYTNRQELFTEEQRWIDMIDPKYVISENTTRGKRRENVRYYNMNLNVLHNAWYQCEEKRLTIGENISKAKKGKTTGPCSEETKAKISKANTGKKRTPEQIEKMRQSKISANHAHTDEWKKEQSERLKAQWDNDTRKRAEPKQTMSIQEQAKQSSSRLKSLWADPVWAANQRKRLAEGAKKRPPRTEESKRKARDAQLGKPKNRFVM